MRLAEASGGLSLMIAARATIEEKAELVILSGGALHPIVAMMATHLSDLVPLQYIEAPIRPVHHPLTYRLSGKLSKRLAVFWLCKRQDSHKRTT